MCWEKAALYLEVRRFSHISGRDVYPLCQVDERYWYCSPGKYVIDPKEAVDLVDEVSISHTYNRPAP